MEEVNYIPGDLVTVKEESNIVWRIIGIKSKVDNDILYSAETLEENPLRMYLWGFQFVPICITPTILETNGWKTQNKWYYFLDINKGFFSSIGIDFVHKSPNNNLYVEVNGSNMAEIQYCHQLQHLLFGLKLPHYLKV